MNVQTSVDSSTTGRHIPALDGIRGLAILLVLANHLLWSNTQLNSPRWVMEILSLHAAGWVGVDLFFVLSGFLITGILYDTLPDPHFFRNFYARRALRIFPLYYAFLLLVMLVSRSQGFHWSHTVPLLTYTENLVPTGLPTDTPWLNINHFWSLAVEEQFYLLWPVLIFLLRKPHRIALAGCLGAAASFGLRLWLWQTHRADANPYILYSWTPCRLDGLLIGAVLAMGIRGPARARLLRAGTPVLCIGLLITAAVYGVCPGLPFFAVPGIAVFLPVVLAFTFAGLIATTLDGAGRVRRVFSASVLRFFGRYSYGLYIFHPTLALLFEPLRFALRAQVHSRWIALLVPALLTLLAAVTLAWLSFRHFESRWLRLKDRFVNHSPRPDLRAFVTRPTGKHLTVPL